MTDAGQLKALAQFCFRDLPDTNINTDCAVGLRKTNGGVFVWMDGQPFNSDLKNEDRMSPLHQEDHMHIEGHLFPHAFLEGDNDGGAGPFLYVCGASLHIHT